MSDADDWTIRDLAFEDVCSSVLSPFERSFLQTSGDDTFTMSTASAPSSSPTTFEIRVICQLLAFLCGLKTVIMLLLPLITPMISAWWQKVRALQRGDLDKLVVEDVRQNPVLSALVESTHRAPPQAKQQQQQALLTSPQTEERPTSSAPSSEEHEAASDDTLADTNVSAVVPLLTPDADSASSSQLNDTDSSSSKPSNYAVAAIPSYAELHSKDDATEQEVVTSAEASPAVATTLAAASSSGPSQQELLEELYAASASDLISSRLGRHILESILSFSTLNDLTHTNMRVSKTWYRSCQVDMVWNPLYRAKAVSFFLKPTNPLYTLVIDQCNHIPVHESISERRNLGNQILRQHELTLKEAIREVAREWQKLVTEIAALPAEQQQSAVPQFTEAVGVSLITKLSDPIQAIPLHLQTWAQIEGMVRRTYELMTEQEKQAMRHPDYAERNRPPLSLTNDYIIENHTSTNVLSMSALSLMHTLLFVSSGERKMPTYEPAQDPYHHLKPWHTIGDVLLCIEDQHLCDFPHTNTTLKQWFDTTINYNHSSGGGGGATVTREIYNELGKSEGKSWSLVMDQYNLVFFQSIASLRAAAAVASTTSAKAVRKFPIKVLYTPNMSDTAATHSKYIVRKCTTDEEAFTLDIPEVSSLALPHCPTKECYISAHSYITTIRSQEKLQLEANRRTETQNSQSQLAIQMRLVASLLSFFFFVWTQGGILTTLHYSSNIMLLFTACHVYWRWDLSGGFFDAVSQEQVTNGTLSLPRKIGLYFDLFSIAGQPPEVAAISLRRGQLRRFYATLLGFVVLQVYLDTVGYVAPTWFLAAMYATWNFFVLMTFALLRLVPPVWIMFGVIQLLRRETIPGALILFFGGLAIELVLRYYFRTSIGWIDTSVSYIRSISVFTGPLAFLSQVFSFLFGCVRCLPFLGIFFHAILLYTNVKEQIEHIGVANLDTAALVNILAHNEKNKKSYVGLVTFLAITIVVEMIGYFFGSLFPIVPGFTHLVVGLGYSLITSHVAVILALWRAIVVVNSAIPIRKTNPIQDKDLLCLTSVRHAQLQNWVLRSAHDWIIQHTLLTSPFECANLNSADVSALELHLHLYDGIPRRDQAQLTAVKAQIEQGTVQLYTNMDYLIFTIKYQIALPFVYAGLYYLILTYFFPRSSLGLPSDSFDLNQLIAICVFNLIYNVLPLLVVLDTLIAPFRKRAIDKQLIYHAISITALLVYYLTHTPSSSTPSAGQLEFLAPGHHQNASLLIKALDTVWLGMWLICG